MPVAISRNEEVLQIQLNTYLLIQFTKQYLTIENVHSSSTRHCYLITVTAQW